MPYPQEIFTNFATSTVRGGAGGSGTPLNPTDTTLLLATGDGNLKFPQPANNSIFRIMVGTNDLMKVIGRSGDTLTLVRAASLPSSDPDFNVTTPPAWPVGTTVQLVRSAGSVTDDWNAINSGRVYNVKDYGAKGDGVTDDSSAITTANTAANAAGGGRVYFPAGTYISGNQTINPLCHYVGDGRSATIIKLKAAANTDLFSAQTGSINLAAANRTGADGTLYGFSFQDLTLDGNNTNQSSGPSYVLRFYGFHYQMLRCDFRNGFSGVILADWNGPDNQPNGVSIESQWSDCKIYTTLGGPIMEFGGPHDSQFSNVLVFDGKNVANDNTGKLTPGLHIGPNAAGFLGVNIHSWNNNLPFLIEAESYFENCIADISNRGAPANQGVGVLILGAPVNWIGGTAFGSSGSSAATGIQIGQAGGITPISPYIVQQSAGLTTAVAPSRCYVDTVILGCDNGGINLSNSGGTNIISGLIHNADNSATGGLQGTPASTDTLRLRVAGITPDGNITTGGANILANDSKQALSVQSATNGHEALRVDTHNMRQQIPYGTYLQGYSDAFITTTWSINKNGAGEIISGGYVASGQSATAAAVATSGTITTAGVGVARVAPTGAVTGVILQAGTVAGQQVTVVNESAAANSVTFAASGTSHVADGNSDVIAGLNARAFVWDSGTSLWYPFK